MGGLDYSERTSWEQTRLLLGPYCKNLKKTFPLPWDDEQDEVDELTQEEIDEMKRSMQLAKAFEERFRNKKD